MPLEPCRRRLKQALFRDMSDIWPPARRSDVMRRIRSSGNSSTENRLIGIFRSHHITGWRRNQNLLGRPDFVFAARRLCVFVDGCFWHGCPKCYRRPTSRQAYWDEKIARNRKRDRLVVRGLKKQGWRVVRIWEHELAENIRGRLLWRLGLYGLSPPS